MKQEEHENRCQMPKQNDEGYDPKNKYVIIAAIPSTNDRSRLEIVVSLCSGTRDNFDEDLNFAFRNYVKVIQSKYGFGISGYQSSCYLIKRFNGKLLTPEIINQVNSEISKIQ